LGQKNGLPFLLSLFCHFGKIRRIYLNAANGKSKFHPSLTEEGYRRVQRWGQKGYAFLDAFVKAISDYYRAGLQEVDFASATEESRRTINTWIAQKTVWETLL